MEERFLILCRARSAQPEKFQGVTDVGESIVSSYGIGPFLHRRSVNFHGVSTLPTHQMVMVVRAAASVDRFPVLTSNDVYITTGRHGLECAIDRGEPHAFTLGTKKLVNLLSGSKIIE